MHGLREAEVDLNRKVLADMAARDAVGFQRLAELAKGALASKS
jgi:large subunit ribosomal protein L20